MSAYEKVVTWLFAPVPNGDAFKITEFGTGRAGNRYACVEDVRKNGQEDDHIYLVVEEVGNGWFYTEGAELFQEQYGSQYADAILAYLDANGLPERDDG